MNGFPSAAVTYCTIEQAAEVLCLTPEALCTRCRRRARKVGRDVVAYLADGIVAIKFGRNWRIKFPPACAPGNVVGSP